MSKKVVPLTMKSNSRYVFDLSHGIVAQQYTHSRFDVALLLAL